LGNLKTITLKEAIIQLTDALKFDYGDQYEKRYSSDQKIKDFKNGLLTRLRGINPEAVMYGYRMAAELSPTFMPNVMLLCEAITIAVKTLQNNKKNLIEAERFALLPAPTITCDPIEMLANAKINTRPTRERMDEMIKAHNALLNIHRDKINHGPPTKPCAIGYCNKAGTISGNTRGDGNFYCKEHFRQYR